MYDFNIPDVQRYCNNLKKLFWKKINSNTNYLLYQNYRNHVYNNFSQIVDGFQKQYQAQCHIIFSDDALKGDTQTLLQGVDYEFKNAVEQITGLIDKFDMNSIDKKFLRNQYFKEYMEDELVSVIMEMTVFHDKVNPVFNNTKKLHDLMNNNGTINLDILNFGKILFDMFGTFDESKDVIEDITKFLTGDRVNSFTYKFLRGQLSHTEKSYDVNFEMIKQVLEEAKQIHSVNNDISQDDFEDQIKDFVLKLLGKNQEVKQEEKKNVEDLQQVRQRKGFINVSEEDMNKSEILDLKDNKNNNFKIVNENNSNQKSRIGFINVPNESQILDLENYYIKNVQKPKKFKIISVQDLNVVNVNPINEQYDKYDNFSLLEEILYSDNNSEELKIGLILDLINSQTQEEDKQKLFQHLLDRKNKDDENIVENVTNAMFGY